jgi:hypothetical protein
MRLLLPLLLFAGCAFADEPKFADAPKPPAGFPKFKVQEIDTGLKIGYAVITTDINGDGKPDIVVVDQHKVVWYENPTWKKRVILDGKTKPDNVCIAAHDIDGDKLPELIVGAGWKPFDTKTPGTLQWLKRGKTLDEEWTMHAIPCEEPTVHRIRMARINDQDQLVLAPLMGRDATKEKNWMDGRPVRILAYPIPKTPLDEKAWKPVVINEDLHVVHNFVVTPSKLGSVLTFGSYEGLTAVLPDATTGKLTWSEGAGDQSTPTASRGSSEVARGSIGPWVANREYGPYATIEPWHGNSLVVYENKQRTVIDAQLRWGHAVAFAELVPKAPDFLIAGVRDNPTQEDKFTEKRGVRIYRNDDKTKKWERYILEDGGVAVEDLTVADLNGDGKPDIIAVGRATGNCRIYWNQGQ